MTRSERLRRAYCHEEMDRPAVYSRTGFPNDDPTYDRLKGYLEAHSELKRGWSGRAFEPRPPVRHAVEPHSADFERHVTTLVTPAGELESRRLESLHGQPGMDETYFIKDRQDAEKYLSLPMPEFAGDTSGFAAALAAVADKGIVDVGLGSNPAGHVAELCGSDTFAIMSMTDRDVLHALCERQMRVVVAALQFLLERGIGPFFSMSGEEYIAPPLHSPADFEDFNVRYDKPIVDLVHEAGGRVHIHCHGSVKKLLPGFLAVGVDVLHPIEPPPMGNVTAAEARQMVGNRICIEGNLQIHHMYEHTPAQVAEETRALIADAFTGTGGLIVSPSASPYIRGEGERCFPRYRAMIDTVLAYRG